VFIELAVGASIVLLGAMAVRREETRDDEPTDDRAKERGASTDADDQVDAALRAAKTRASKSPKAQDKKNEKSKKSKKGGDAEPNPSETRRARPDDPRGLRVGDVILYADSELWLAGEVHFDEEGFALSLFMAPGGARATHIVQLDAEAREVALLSKTSDVPDGSVPTELPIDGLRVKLRRRGHADVRTEGEHLPLTTERAEYVILGGPGGKTVLVVDFAGGDRLALVGEVLGREMYDLLPGGD
jgi:hypothetical protein